MRIAIFHYHWFLQIHTKLLIDGLLKEGNFVDLYLYNMKDNYVILNKCDHLNVFTQKTRGIFFIFCSRALSFLYKKIYFLRNMLSWVYDIYLESEIKSFFISQSYDLMIGIDKGGGILAHEQSKKDHCPYIYYSLELYNENADYRYGLLDGAMARQEKNIVEYAKAIIIQDNSRAEIFSKRLKKRCKFIYLPVSINDQHIHCAEKIKRCVVFGNNHFISNNDLVVLSKSIPKDWHILLHNIDSSREKKFLEKHTVNNIIVSEGYMDDDAISMLLSTSMIGLAFYGDDDENVQKIIFSSEKVARYLGAGLPIITTTLGNSSILFDAFPCGIAIRDFSEIGEAILKISLDYTRYSTMALAAFEKYYHFDNNFTRIYPILTAIGKQGQNDCL